MWHTENRKKEGERIMIRITKFKTKAEDPQMYEGRGTTQEIYIYKALDGDKIIGTFSVQADLTMADSMAKTRLCQYVFNQIKIEEITELENKEIIEKDKINKINKDFE